MNEPERGEIINNNIVEEETVTAPAKVMRIGSMIKQ